MKLEHLMEYTITLTNPPDDTPEGPYGTRRIYTFTGGSFEGPRLSGRILPSGGDWLLRGGDGIGRVDHRASLETDDGAQIYLQLYGINRTEPTHSPRPPSPPRPIPLPRHRAKSATRARTRCGAPRRRTQRCARSSREAGVMAGASSSLHHGYRSVYGGQNPASRFPSVLAWTRARNYSSASLTTRQLGFSGSPSGNSMRQKIVPWAWLTVSSQFG